MGYQPYSNLNMSNHKQNRIMKNKRLGLTKIDALTGKVINGEEVVAVKNAVEYVKQLGYRVVPLSFYGIIYSLAIIGTLIIIK